MKHWRWSSKNIFGLLLTADLVALWVYGIVNQPMQTLAVSAICGLWAWRNWPEEKR